MAEQGDLLFEFGVVRDEGALPRQLLCLLCQDTHVKAAEDIRLRLHLAEVCSPGMDFVFVGLRPSLLVFLVLAKLLKLQHLLRQWIDKRFHFAHLLQRVLLLFLFLLLL